jgi:hypothetical protein
MTDISLPTLVDLNVTSLHNKIAAVKNIRGTYRANDLIDVVSESPERDKRLINSYATDEVMIRRIKCKGYLRTTRFFTKKGIARYVVEGKLFNYKNVCAFFGIEPRDLEREKLEQELADLQDDDDPNLYDVKKVLRWLFEKRKSNKALGEHADLVAIYGWINTLDDDEKDIINATKLAIISELVT